MKKMFFVISVVCALLFGAGCSSKPTTPPEPARKAAPAQPATKPTPTPEPPKPETVTLVSATPFHLANSYESGKVESENGPDAEPAAGKFQKVVERSQFKVTQYATLIPSQHNGAATISKFIRIPPEAFADASVKTLILDDPKLEALDAKGWKLGRITVYTFRSEFGSDRKVVRLSTGDDAEQKSLDELQRSAYFWRIVRNSAGVIYAEPDERGMLTSFSPDGIAGFIAYQREKNPNSDSIAAIKSPGQYYTAGYQAVYLAGRYQYLWKAFNKLPQGVQMAAIDTVGPFMARLAIEKVEADVIRRYATDLSWVQIEKCPVVEPSSWPHSDPDAPIANYGGLTKKQYDDVGHALLFWGRRGQPVFERVKAVFLRELAKTPAAAPGRR